MKKAKATIDFEVWNLDCPNCGADHKLDRKGVESEFLYCSECGEAFEPEVTGQEADLLEACEKMLSSINANCICEQLHNDDAELLSEIMADVYVAITKAKGRGGR